MGGSSQYQHFPLGDDQAGLPVIVSRTQNLKEWQADIILE